MKHSSQILKNASSITAIGTLNWAIHTLTIIRERIDVGQKVKYKDIDLTPDTYKELLHEHYGIYVVKGV